jgi:hypothetical protein
VSYSYYDANGDLGQGPNSAGRDMLDAWAQDEELPLTQKFLEDGETDNPEALADELKDVRPNDGLNTLLSSMVNALHNAAEQAEEILIISED